MVVEHEAGSDAVTPSSGNVFNDLGLEYSEEDMLKVAIARAITSTIKLKKLTQAEAGKIIGEDQARVSELTRGRLTRFSVQKLIVHLLALGRDINIEIPAKVREERGKLKVRATR
jgi:predicted XRE-type DNA-binding protein